MECLAKVLKSFKGAICLTIADIIGIPPGICSHKIQLMPIQKPSIEHQILLNPPMHELAKKYNIKLLDDGVIYLIADYSWVCVVQSVPKKGGMTVVPNDNNELVTRIFMDYWKLNAWKEKDHFLLPFMDHMLDRLAGKGWYYFLNGYSGNNQISIELEDQEKTTFACTYGTFALKRMPFRLCNAPTTHQIFMMSIFSDII
nr:uncharacterized protein LOC104647835 [Solanum lycopersicum]